MKKLLLLTAVAAFSTTSFSQTVLLFEDFETGGASFDLNTADEGGVDAATGDNQWIVNSTYGGVIGTEFCNFSDVVVQNIPSQPGGISSADGAYMHMYSDQVFTDFGNDNCNIMTADGSCAAAESNFAAMNTDISTIGLTGVTVDFWWICEATGTAFGKLWYSTDGGSSWTAFIGIPDMYANTDWMNENVSDAAWDGQATLRFGFRFENGFDGSFNNYIGFGIDDFEITGTCGLTASVVDNGDGTLTASPSGGGETFQWVDCDNGFSAVAGATSDTYDAAVHGDGNVACVVTSGGCMDTTACTNVMANSVYENNFTSKVLVFPNPTEDKVSIEFGQTYSEIELVITDLSGRIVSTETYFNVNSLLDIKAPAESGVYFVNLTNEKGETAVLRILKK